jgi:Na+-driven multidrug efflux pump
MISCPWRCAAQPFDAAAAVMDGGLLGASETAYASRATLVVAACVYCLLSVVPRLFPGQLFGVWLSLKGLSVGRTLAAGYRLSSAKSPLSKELTASLLLRDANEKSPLASTGAFSAGAEDGVQNGYGG